ncbi:helix-turn-helix transcriptional regulator [uncultured Xylophilus sp.]|uniref:helix-turn-helix transcriptional regulator n=1 Tax=uncultured Xylophilus sp. TaxID=296832 RepID=UPI0025F909B7|nr:helix-turn-helix transcriptional regulator [uncultured Xylophilus sp.]
MRRWQPAPVADRRSRVLADWVGHVGSPDFGQAVLDGMQDLLPAASWSVYRVGAAPRLFLSASRGVPDTTHDCWRAYLSGPHRRDRSLPTGAAAARAPLLCHLTAGEVSAEHRAKVYEAHGMAERISVAEAQADGTVFAVNFYRHGHQRAFTDTALDDFGALALPLLALVRRHTVLAAQLPAGPPAAGFDARLQQVCPALTVRERAVCVRLLQGMTQDGIAADLALAVPTVKTYRNRAFARLGIHSRHELHARLA